MTKEPARPKEELDRELIELLNELRVLRSPATVLVAVGFGWFWYGLTLLRRAERSAPAR